MSGLQWAEIQMLQVILDINICVTGPKASTQFSSTLCKEALLQRNEVIEISVTVGKCKGRYTLGDKFQQHVAVTHCSNKSLRVYWRIFVKIFVAATEFCCRNKSQRFDFLRLVAATKFCCGDKDFHKNSPVHTKRFVAATCRLTV